eukprot:2619748-Pyramimonas_sp.AAC.1
MADRPRGRKTPGPDLGDFQPAESDFDSGTDTDTSSDDEATALDYSEMSTYLTEEQQAQWLFLGYEKHRRRWRRFMKKP